MVGPKHFLLGSVALFALTGFAAAADMPIRAPQPAYKAAPAHSIWEGAYIGVHVGYGWARNDVSVPGVGATEFSPDGVIGGLQFGYNRQIGRNWVLGYEVDFSASDFAGRRAIGAVSSTFDMDYFGTARTRLGYVNGPWMVYVTGGLAWANSNVNVPGTISVDRPQVGYTLGAGVEYMFARNWSAKFEYLYLDLDSTNATIGAQPISTDLSTSIVRIGLNYRFANLPVEAFANPAFPTKARPVGFTWSGPYIGAHGGFGQGNFVSVINGLPATAMEPSGGFGGIQSGYNWQFSRNWVVGIEADSSWGSLNDTVGGANIDIDAMGTVRARLGYAMNNWLFYGTGGLAWVHADSVQNGPIVNDRFYLGWAVGAGVEYSFSPRWSAKVEYIYSDYGTLRDTLAANTIDDSLSVSTVKFGINYRASVLDLIGMRW